MNESIAVDREDAIQVAKKLRFEWLKNVLSQTGMDLTGCFPEVEEEELGNPENLSIENRGKLRQVLNQNDIYLSDLDGSFQNYIEKNLIGEWKKPKFELREDFSQIDPKKRLYTVIKIEYWSVFDVEEEE